MKDIENLEDIKFFVDEFYLKVKTDDLIGSIFLEKILEDWQPHLNQMYAFWNAALFGESGFRGNPFAKHAILKIEKRHFVRWLVLFDETIDLHFYGEIAQDAKNIANLMAEMFLNRLQKMTRGSDKIIF